VRRLRARIVTARVLRRLADRLDPWFYLRAFNITDDVKP
jgi:hypothetical protein